MAASSAYGGTLTTFDWEQHAGGGITIGGAVTRLVCVLSINQSILAHLGDVLDGMEQK